MKSAPSLKPAVSELPKATYFVKSAVPAVTGTSVTLSPSSFLLHATKVKETKSSHLKFFIILLIFLIYNYGLITHEINICCPIEPAPTT